MKTITYLDLADKKINVAIYGRVSTSHENQDISLDMQINGLKTIISNMENWSLAGIYVDRSSGKDMFSRKALTHLRNECLFGKIDLILV